MAEAATGVSRDALLKKAIAAHQAGRIREAASLYRQIVKAGLANAEIYNNLGITLRQLGERPAALVCYERSLAIKPESGSAMMNKANVLRDLGRYAEAEQLYRQVCAHQGDVAHHWFNLALVVRDQGRLEEARELVDRARAIDPDSAEYDWDYSLTSLQMGDLAGGFAVHDSRWRLRKVRPLDISGERWDGAPLEGRTLLVVSEQGFGDAIQFSRIVPWIKEKKGGRVIFSVRPELLALLKDLPGVDEVVSRDRKQPDFDFYIAFMDLPHILGLTKETIPPPPDLSANLPDVALPPAPAGTVFKVGIVWGGSPTHQNDRNRSCPIDIFVALMDRPDVAFYSFQKGERSTELAKAAPGPFSMLDAGAMAKDFADSGAMMKQLDLLITVDTSAAHLAGTLGVPTFILLPYSGDWRWFRHGTEDSPWYESVRLFWQDNPRDWDSVTARVRTALAEAVDARRTAAA